LVLDRGRFPRAAAYYASLPEGLDSFPDCLALTETYAGVRDFMSGQGDVGELPGPVADYLAGRVPEKKWGPEVVPMVLQMMVFDILGDEATMRWFYEDATRIFKGPLMRFMMRLISPTLVVMGASSRWNALRRGTELSADPVQKMEGRLRTTARLEFPDGLYPHAYLRGLEQSFTAALDGARGAEVQVALAEVIPGEAHYYVSWAR
jgi:hypothetical protein